MSHLTWKLNTSNPGKFLEFEHLFASHGYALQATQIDLDEIDADPCQVVSHKACQLGENILVEDTSLEIDGASVGVNIRWLLNHLTQFVGQRALWTVLLAVRQENCVCIYRGCVAGTIVSSQGTGGFGFDPVFLPDGVTQTLAESKTDSVNARALAVSSFFSGDVWVRHPIIETWQGRWQNN